ncbi:MAG: alpha-hydroxy acid oxidase [Myxococcota bacterium]|nr:alpha-hydroxy acid oxidase [Myxococcota bacterium]
MTLVRVDEYEPLAREKLAAMAFDYYVSGARDELTLRRNKAAWKERRLLPRLLVDVSVRDTSTQVLGTPVSAPIVVAPTAFHAMAHPEGECATARGAGAAGTVMVLSTLSNRPVEEVVAAATGPIWFQLYVYRDRSVTEALVQRVEAAGCSALVLTVDAPVFGTRERDVRNGFHLPEGLGVANLLPAGHGALPAAEGNSGLSDYVDRLFDPSLSWADLAWLRSITSLPIVIKGLVRADDALRAAEAGVDGIVVSNHGGRQLDTTVATAEALGPVVDAVGDRLEVLVDGGIRRGTDVLKAVALGARAVLVGRPVLWGLTVDGAAGVEAVLGMLRSELDQSMALCGCPTVSEITGDLIAG